MQFTKLKLVIVVANLLGLFFLGWTISYMYHTPYKPLPSIRTDGETEINNSNVENKSPVLPALPFLRSWPISKDVILRSVHFDDRPRNGHRNMYVFMVGANRTIIDSKWIVGCGVNNMVAKKHSVNFTQESLIMHKFVGSNKPFLYEEVIVECYDLPKVNSGSSAFILYKTTSDSPVYVVESEHSVWIPAPRIKPLGEYDFTVITCTKIHNKGAAWMQEFIKYQETVGVDHVHVNILDSFIKDGGMGTLASDRFVAKAVEKGFLSFTVWTDWYKSSSDVGKMSEIKQSEIYLHSEILRKLDCMYRFRGTYDYVFVLDTDDFFTPRISGKPSVKHYIQRFANELVGSLRFDWIWYYPEACGMEKGPIEDGNVTNRLHSYKGEKNGNKKSLHKTSALVDATFHEASCKTCLMPGYKVVQIPTHIAYVAHLRKNRKPKDGC